MERLPFPVEGIEGSEGLEVHEIGPADIGGIIDFPPIRGRKEKEEEVVPVHVVELDVFIGLVFAPVGARELELACVASPVLLPHEIEREVEPEFPEIGSFGRKVEPNPPGKGGNFQDGRLIAGRKGIHVPVLF